MIIADAALEKREREGAPIRVGIVGAGYIARGIVSQLLKPPVGIRLAAISNRMHTGDITTLANPDIVEQIRELVQGRVTTPLSDGPADIKLFCEEQ